MVLDFCSIVLSFAVFFFGSIIGSFLNCIVYRLRRDENFLTSRSCCPKCGHRLSWPDLIPIFSFLFLGGRCRYCHQRISLQYPAVEILTGTIFLLVFIFNFSSFSFMGLLEIFYLLVVSCFLIIIFVYDLKYYIIPDEIIYPAIGTVFLYKLLVSYFCSYNLHFESLIFSFFSAIFSSAFFLFIFLISRGRWMGFGDVKLAFLMGLFLDFPKVLFGLFFAFFIGAIIGIGLIIARKKTLKSKLPFAPFLVAGSFIALFWGDIITRCYLTILR